MTTVEQLRMVPLFEGLPAGDLERLRTSVEAISLPVGSELFREGDIGDRAYVILSGVIEILKHTDRREVVLALRGSGEVIGEMALLREAPRIATARARTATELVTIPKAELDRLLDSSPAALRAMFNALLDRWQATQDQLRQGERMAQLGTLTAGLAHELNNPASAVARAAEELPAAIARLSAAERELYSALPDEDAAALVALQDRLRGSGARPGLDAVERSDREAAVEAQLEELGVTDGWRLAPGLVDAGLDDVGPAFSAAGGRGAQLLEAVDADQDVRSLVREADVATQRVLGLVKALKSYTYLDRGPVQEVDVVEGLEDTILILGARLRGHTVRREYARDLPTIEGHGAELNQVWTNLLGNAVDAIEEAGREPGVVVIRASSTPDVLAVEIEDDGVGIPAESIDRIFDSFYTTKPPGSGTGLGLHIAYRIVVLEHRGDMSVSSEPGRTVFRVELPRRQP